MALIKWDNSFIVNVGVIDNQHQRLVSMVNDLHEAMEAGKGQDALGEIVDGLVHYTRTHFVTEEKYFDQFGYPEAAPHIREHDVFTEKISEFQTGMQEGKLGLSIQVMYFLRDWLKDHIKESDMKYSRFFNEKGLR